MCALAHWSRWNTEGKRMVGPEPRLSRSKSARSWEPQRRAPEKRAGTSLRPEARSVLRHRASVQDSSWAGTSTQVLPELRTPLLQGALAGPETGARTPCCRCSALAVGTKTLLPALAPGPGPRPVKGWAPCGVLGLGVVLQRLGAPGRYLCNAGPGPGPADPPPYRSARGSCYQE